MSQRLGALTAPEEWQVWGRCSWLVPDQLTPQMQKNPKVELINEEARSVLSRREACQLLVRGARMSLRACTAPDD